ncbi:MAG TPA: DUF4010 domain-containing protein [Blastocatellia bacterium]|nr:DUF4010 domain-containing protein [Blastocatellia bacterium]
MDLTFVFERLGIALGLGLLVGLQRESAASRLAGIRTFPLVTFLGAVSAMVAQPLGGLVIAGGFIALAILILVGKASELKDGPVDPGLTTEVAMLLMFGVGAYLIVGHLEAAIAIGGTVAVLLQFKGQMHGVVEKLGEGDLKAIMQFALISLVILPVLPNESYGPYSVLNPQKIWWMVVLVVGISLGGYIIYKFFGKDAGVLLGGVLGGTISSTATTVTYSRRAAHSPADSRLAAVIIMIASAIVFVRLLLIIVLVARPFLRAAAPPLLIMLLVLWAPSVVMWFRGRREPSDLPEQENPSELRSALLFGMIYAIVLLAVAAAKDRFGNRGLFVVASLSGLTDVDAITLSTSQLVTEGRLAPAEGWKVILVATMSNLVFKGGAVAVLAGRTLLARVAPLYALALGVGALLLILWP